MGFYSEYLSTLKDFGQIEKERKKQLSRISEIRQRPVIVYASDISKGSAPILIDYTDILPFSDQLSNIVLRGFLWVKVSLSIMDVV